MDWEPPITSGSFVEPPRPRTWMVLGLLAATAATFSYLGAYALHGTLISAGLIQAPASSADPRPRWFLTGFCVLMLVFVVLGGLFRLASRRDFHAIDAMADAEEQDPLD